MISYLKSSSFISFYHSNTSSRRAERSSKRTSNRHHDHRALTAGRTLRNGIHRTKWSRIKKVYFHESKGMLVISHYNLTVILFILAAKLVTTGSTVILLFYCVIHALELKKFGVPYLYDLLQYIS